MRIVDLHRHHSLSFRFDEFGDLKAEGTKGAAVFTNLFAVDKDPGDDARRLETEEKPFPGRQRFRLQPQAVPADAAMIFAGLPILGIPGVRDRDRRPVGIGKARLRRRRHIAKMKTPSLFQRLHPFGRRHPA